MRPIDLPAQFQPKLLHGLGAKETYSTLRALTRKDLNHDIQASLDDFVLWRCSYTFDFGDFRAGAAKLGHRLHKGENKSAVNYHQIGFGADQPPTYKSLKTLVNELGHNKRTVDIFKIDCEGCEWSTAKHWFDADITLRQIQIELHSSNPNTTPEFFDFMYENNYVITHKESNIEYTGPANDVCIEYAFLKLAPEFFAGYEREKGVQEV